MLRDLTLVQLLENACTAGILFILIALMFYFILCVVGDIKTARTKRRGAWRGGCD
ncbi:MAG: hypothetical protein QG606_143 [Patescibacteria group bacterium]|nr:hypothetical protein [Patescibacteria group bacterium]